MNEPYIVVSYTQSDGFCRSVVSAVPGEKEDLQRAVDAQPKDDWAGTHKVYRLILPMPVENHDTGLPELEVGWWRIRSNYVQVMRQLTVERPQGIWFWRTTVTEIIEDALYTARISEDNESRLRLAIFGFKALLNEDERKSAIDRERLAKRSKLNGDYPPRKLEG